MQKPLRQLFRTVFQLFNAFSQQGQLQCQLLLVIIQLQFVTKNCQMLLLFRTGLFLISFILYSLSQDFQQLYLPDLHVRTLIRSVFLDLNFPLLQNLTLIMPEKVLIEYPKNLLCVCFGLRDLLHRAICLQNPYQEHSVHIQTYAELKD